MKIYTKTGDKGETGLFGGGRVTKDSIRIEAYGTIDELNSSIGLALTEVKGEIVRNQLIKIQNLLFVSGGDLASPSDVKGFEVPRIKQKDIQEIEGFIDLVTEQIEELRYFILPGGCKSAALLHVARTVCRRAERRVVALKKGEEINENIVIFINRISDLLFVLARYENKLAGKSDIRWEK
ncbi:MAG: cob(I)yrinic acid a,c-diamide adenosyltransferase [Ignavibacteriales bacterium]|nr:cob(I)yrinic acid a,c-diamide adenosyltransferase [Ignavibacteriaceae bacterium]NLH61872.1 cob(I)yrinic acid a,c-diamide adenosyltransferase [Ignavibacteriales bacterium]HOJ17925.1 cob(I)yrinic acid a,c-diamide adenosyltransferase [Ignavibacteriaceae bacterium]HPO54968.1 cob(I)yrinic acid a,c-diamide adenosyltransferase [Ignavibacteriaceae bacterium]